MPHGLLPWNNHYTKYCDNHPLLNLPHPYMDPSTNHLLLCLFLNYSEWVLWKLVLLQLRTVHTDACDRSSCSLLRLPGVTAPCLSGLFHQLLALELFSDFTIMNIARLQESLLMATPEQIYPLPPSLATHDDFEATQRFVSSKDPFED